MFGSGLVFSLFLLVSWISFLLRKICKRYKVGFVVERYGGLIRGGGYFESECRSWLWLFDMYMFL